MLISDLVEAVDERGVPPDATALSVSEVYGIVPQDRLFKKKIALKDRTKYRPVRRGDIVYNPFLLWAGAVGACFEDGGSVSPAYQVLRPRVPGTSRLLHYFFRSDRFTNAVIGLATGTVTRRRVAPLADLMCLEFDLPERHYLQAASQMLEELDGKIESNGRIAEICRALIRLELDVLQDESWPAIPLSSLARFVNGGAYTMDATGSGRMVIRIAELSKGPGHSTVYNELVVPDDHVARAGDILMAWSGSLGVHVWSGYEAIVNQHIFKVLPDGYPSWFVFDRIERVMPQFRQVAADKATTMGHIKRHHLDDALVRVPIDAVLAEMDALVGPQWLRALAADLESRTLGELRDALLPELLSGRLHVPDADAELAGEAI